MSSSSSVFSGVSSSSLNRNTSYMVDVNNYQIEKLEQRGKYILLMIHYPSCTNYEGRKILLFKDVTIIHLMNQRAIDPHFLKDTNKHHPIARFEPTDAGWAMGMRCMTGGTEGY